MNVKLSTILVGLIILILFLGGMNPSGCGGDMLKTASKTAARTTVPAWSGTFGGNLFWFLIFFIVVFLIAWLPDSNRPHFDSQKLLLSLLAVLIFGAFIVYGLREGSRVKKGPGAYTEQRR